MIDVVLVVLAALGGNALMQMYFVYPAAEAWREFTEGPDYDEYDGGLAGFQRMVMNGTGYALRIGYGLGMVLIVVLHVAPALVIMLALYLITSEKCCALVQTALCFVLGEESGLRCVSNGPLANAT